MAKILHKKIIKGSWKNLYERRAYMPMDDRSLFQVIF